MRVSSPSAIVVVVLVVLAGCTGLPDAGDSRPSPDEFPNASAINPSVFDRHAAVLADTSFTLSTEKTRKVRNPIPLEKNYTYMNGSGRFFVEPGASQYLAQVTGYFVGENVTYYSNGSTTYVQWREHNELTVKKVRHFPIFNESSERYLWGGWFNHDTGPLDFAAINATYEREGVEMFHGVPVMRYEARGVDALPDLIVDGNESSYFEEFSATLLLDEDGVIRYFRYEFVYATYRIRRITRAYTLTDVGSTDVQKPEWMSKATTGS